MRKNAPSWPGAPRTLHFCSVSSSTALTAPLWPVQMPAAPLLLSAAEKAGSGGGLPTTVRPLFHLRTCVCSSLRPLFKEKNMLCVCVSELGPYLRRKICFKNTLLVLDGASLCKGAPQFAHSLPTRKAPVCFHPRPRFFLIFSISLLVSRGCHYEVPQNGWLITELCLTTSEAGSPKSRGEQDCFLLGGPRR